MNESGIEILETVLEDWIYNHLTGKEYCDNLTDIYEDYSDDYPSSLSVHRQFNIGSYGIIDLITFDEDVDTLNITIYELKKGDIDKNALTQILKYKTGVEEICTRFGLSHNPIECVLIGGCLSDIDDFSVAVTSIPFLSVFTYKLNPTTGIEIKSHDITFKKLNLPSSTNKTFYCLDLKFHDMACLYHNHIKHINKKG